jgi:hypothetical protein
MKDVFSFRGGAVEETLPVPPVAATYAPPRGVELQFQPVLLVGVKVCTPSETAFVGEKLFHSVQFAANVFSSQDANSIDPIFRDSVPHAIDEVHARSQLARHG